MKRQNLVSGCVRNADWKHGELQKLKRKNN